MSLWLTEVGSVLNIDIQEQEQDNKTLLFLCLIVVTHKGVLQEDFDSGIPSIENSYLQTANSKQQTTNRNETMALKLTRE
jgi:hypothetical protein